MSHGQVEGEDAHVAAGYVVDVRVEEAQYEAVLLDVRVHHPGLAIAVVELSGLRRVRERIEHDRKDAVDLDEVEARHELAAHLEQLFDLVHAIGVGGAVHVRVLLDDARVVHEGAIDELVAVADAAQVIERAQATHVELETRDVTHRVQLGLYAYVPLVVAERERARDVLGVLLAARIVRIVAIVGGGGRGRYLRLVRVVDVDVLELELALYRAALVHEVERAQRVDGGERLAALLRGGAARELALLLGKRFVACEMLAIDERDRVVGRHQHVLVHALERQVAAQLALALHERERPLEVGAREVARLELAARVQHERARYHEREHLGLVAIVREQEAEQLRHLRHRYPPRR